MRFCFVILHYMAVGSTIECIQSILSNYGSRDISILVVDNASPDGSGIALKKKYANDKRIEIILNFENSGFARANNLGFKHCKNAHNPDFIVFCNNDIVFDDVEFIDKIGELYNSNGFDVLGPDITNADGLHQNPLYESQLTLPYLKKMLLKAELKVHMLRSDGPLSSIFTRYRKAYEDNNIPIEFDYTKSSDSCVLYGACMVFSRKYIYAHEDAFCPETFMYFEESILKDIIDSENGRMLYYPLLHVLHQHGASTHTAYSDTRKHSLFIAEQYVKSIKAAIKIRKSRDYS